MKAIIYTEYGPPSVLKLDEIPTPDIQKDEVLIEVHASSLNKGDWHLMRGEPFPVRFMFGLRKPKIRVLGSDVAGRIVATGSDVTMFAIDDAVFGTLDSSGFGGFAEYVSVKESALALKPTNLSFAEAAAVPQAALTALQGLRTYGKLQEGQQVLIHGASGGVGGFAVQIAKALGAEVTGVCRTQKIDFVRSLGANHIVDYTQEDCTSSGKQYDLILDAAAYRSILDFKRAIKPGGKYIMVGGSGKSLLQIMTFGPIISAFTKVTMRNYLVNPNQEDLKFLCNFLQEGKIRPSIDRCFPLEATVEAMRCLEERKVQGKMVIDIRDAQKR